MSPEELIARTGLTRSQIDSAVRGNKGMIALPGWLVDRTWLDATRAAIIEKIREFHRDRPLLPGIPKQDLGAGLPAPLLDALLSHPQITEEGGIVRHRTHRVVLQQQEQQARAAIESAFEKAGLAVPPVDGVLAQTGIDSARARSLLQILIREGQLIRISDDLVFHRGAIDRLRSDLMPPKGARLSVPAFKERTGISRKYAIPLLEYLDREKVTRRDGDDRIVL